MGADRLSPGGRKVIEACAYFDGGLLSLNPGPGACAVVIVGEDSSILCERTCRFDHATNNEAEYRGLLLAAKTALLLGVDRLHLLSDSQLVVSQVGKLWAVNDAKLACLHHRATSALMRLDEWSLQHVPRAQNARADQLCNMALRPDGRVARKAEAPAPFLRGERLIRGFAA
jgi:ribonuclease HI